MQLTNSAATYGAVTKTFHWLIALLILAQFALGFTAVQVAEAARAAQGDGAQGLIDRATLLFSMHKTLGVAIFFTAVARILWALSQPKPGLLNGDAWLESRLAETVHWLLYGSLVMVPLSGWVHHAADAGYAPIWWPFGQGLPFVPKSEWLSGVAGTLHYLLQWVLAVAIGLHVAGALKHHLVDRDATLRRMLPGQTPAEPTARQPGHALPTLAALAIWVGVLGLAYERGWFAQAPGGAATLDAVASDWQVQEGALSIAITQMGATVEGHFNEWTAEITYDEAAAPGLRGAVTVTVSIPSLTLGSVTEQAMGPEYFAAADYPTARFTADILRGEDGALIAEGDLRIRDASVPVRLPFELQIADGTATAHGAMRVDRGDFGIGAGVDADTLGAGVDISFELTATRTE
ncbi:cytochrome [Roseovarius spongiae]|uniref:Cytochrome n=1 Tax=Roseovarius spongiae TaxID=2320272 RepID=A0A3A8B5H4_9RHOB|nr:cytochrome b/b6 domain-containing protein [Roseovarius spongiae]RKF14776.1 cytochrome [Roseovarius spongiae]